MGTPALRRLLADFEAGKVDCVVVYKLNGISRSLLEFAKIVESFERNNVSFVSMPHLCWRVKSNGLLSTRSSELAAERGDLREPLRSDHVELGKLAATARPGDPRLADAHDRIREAERRVTDDELARLAGDLMGEAEVTTALALAIRLDQLIRAAHRRMRNALESEGRRKILP